MFVKYVWPMMGLAVVGGCSGPAEPGEGEETASEQSALCEQEWSEEEGWHDVCSGSDGDAAGPDSSCRFINSQNCSMMSCSDGGGSSCCIQADGSMYCCFWNPSGQWCY